MTADLQDAPLTGSPVDASLDGNVISINDCPACHSGHVGLKITEYNAPRGPFTHWYLCPSLGDPCNISLAAMKNGQGMELDSDVCQALAIAQQAGRWMVAIWWIHDNGETLSMVRPTYKFPIVEFEHAVRLLREKCQQEIGPPQPDVMQAADHPQPLTKLFGE